MSKFFAGLCAGAILLSQTACSLHPLPDDVVALPTYMIVRKIRCEAREAVKDQLRVYLERITWDPVAQDIAIRLKNPGADLEALPLARLSPPIKRRIGTFKSAGIAYNFTFDMTEANTVDPTLDLLNIFSNGTLSLGISAQHDRTRQNVRSFTVTDTFAGLFTLKWDYCEGKLATGKNFIYPIAGKIGLAEMINTFINLSLFGGLDGEKGKGPPTMADTLKFTTHMSLTVNPSITITPGTIQPLKVHSGLLGVANSRTDEHTVIVGLALDSGEDIPEFLHGVFVTASGTRSEVLAGAAVEQQINRFEAGNRVSLRDTGF